MFIKLSKEEDLKTLKKLGYNIYDDMKIAQKVMEQNYSKDKFAFEKNMYNIVTSKSYIDLKKLLGKNDYMERCTNTNAKCIVLGSILCAELQMKINPYLKCDFIKYTEDVLHYYTERRVHPKYNRVFTMTDIIDLISCTTEPFLGDDFYNAMQDYLASMIYYYNL